MPEETLFLDIFGCCASHAELCGGLNGAKVRSVTVSREERSMDVEASFARPPSSGELTLLENCLAEEYGLREVRIRADLPPGEKPAEKKRDDKKNKPAQSKALLGKMPKNAARSEIRDLTAESGTVLITGVVFEADSRKIAKNNAAVLSFSITDYTGSIRVSKYLRTDDDRTILDKIRVGDRLSVRGNVVFNRYDGDIAIEPSAITLEPPLVREDDAPGEKRVELHLHTRYSALDALTDPEAAVKTAARWGHKAIAVTDHGVAQAFPDFWHAGDRQGIKIIYGLEGYYVNDVDDMPALFGETDLPWTRISSALISRLRAWIPRATASPRSERSGSWTAGSRGPSRPLWTRRCPFLRMWCSSRESRITMCSARPPRPRR